MKKSLVTIIAVIALLCAFGSSAYAIPMTYTTAGVVGTKDGAPGSLQEEELWAQFLLDQGLGYNVAPYRTNEAFEYSGTIQVPGTKKEGADLVFDVDGNLVVPAGYQYLFAKYNGQSAGYVLFDLTVFGTTIPNYPVNFWTTEDKWELSHYVLYNGVSVPDGGSVVMLLGAALMGLAGFRRFVK